MKLKVVIVDYGVGNTHSVANAIKVLGYQVEISKEVDKIRNAHALILPGVGAFEKAINNLREHNLDEILSEEVLIKAKPILGICLGMQMMATISEENGLHKGLNWIPGKVVKLAPENNLPVPHVGWNNLEIRDGKLYNRLADSPHFYFDHSFHFRPDNASHISAICNYAGEVIAAIQFNNICGVQFHPEKSQIAGLKVFRSFLNSVLQNA